MRPPDRISRGFALSDFRTQESYHSRCHFRVPRNCQGDAAPGARNSLLIIAFKTGQLTCRRASVLPDPTFRRCW
jgi:hypothetical protein